MRFSCASKQSTETSKETLELLLENVREGNGEDWRQHTKKVTHDQCQGFLSDRLVSGLGEKLAEDDKDGPGDLGEKAGKVTGEVDGILHVSLLVSGRQQQRFHRLGLLPGNMTIQSGTLRLRQDITTVTVDIFVISQLKWLKFGLQEHLF